MTSSRRDLNECSVGGGDVCAVHSGDADAEDVNTGAIRNDSRRRHPSRCHWGVKWRLVGHGDGRFFEILRVDC